MRAAVKERAAENVRRSFKADQGQGTKATHADQAAGVSAGGHVENTDRGLRRRGANYGANSGANRGANSKATQADQAAEVPAGGHVENKVRDLRRRRRRRRRKEDGPRSSVLVPVLRGDSPISGLSSSAMVPGL